MFKLGNIRDRVCVYLQPTTTSTTLLTGTISGDGSAILNPANLHASSGQGAEGALSPGPGSLGSVAAGGAELDVQRGDAQGLDLLGDVLGGQHSGVGGGFVTISLHLHTTSDST